MISVDTLQSIAIVCVVVALSIHLIWKDRP